MTSTNDYSQGGDPDDDGSIIVYGDSTSPNKRWFLSQSSVTRNTNSSQQPLQNRSRDRVLTPSRILQKQDRRKRHRAWNQIQKEEVDGHFRENRFSDDEEHQLRRPANDPFASLECLVEQLSQEQRERYQQQQQQHLSRSDLEDGKIDGSNEEKVPNEPNVKRKGKENAATSDDLQRDGNGHSQRQKSCQENTETIAQRKIDLEVVATTTTPKPYIAPSPPDFDICVHNDHDYRDEEDTQEHALDAATSLQTPQLGGDKVKAADVNQDLPPMTVEKVKSLVGLRPATWLRNNRGSTSNKRPVGLGSRSLASKHSPKVSVLAAATRKPFVAKISNSKPQRHSIDSKSLYEIQRCKPPNGISPMNHNNKDTSNAYQGGRNDTKINVTFAPSFVSSANSAIAPAAPIDTLIEEPTRQEDYFANIHSRPTDHLPAILSSPQPHTKRRRTSKITGKWERRLAALRKTRCSDAGRLQNQAYARHAGIELNNPRKRAASRTDVTILGVNRGPRNLPDDCVIAVLGYIHSHAQNMEGKRFDQIGHLEKQKDVTIIHRNIFSWITFKISTARTIGLENGCRLRLYDAIVLPSPQATRLSLPEKFIHWSGVENHCCQNTVICTDLCERTDDE
ncbi:hypothetical protein IV203_036181 [Nitzschia inconspicua]|uniref:Uncharacterized protein n=1 Tax=Nitzschia inconspicua TaxID=303405 RepID=A0A9K3LHM3_9STRA|nr:hypothetical protein IV203_036181 [Nitzschia inconspicua]